MRRLFLAAILIGAVVLAGCKKKDETPTAPSLTTPSNPAVTNSSGQPGPNVSNITNYNGMMATIQYNYTTPAYPPLVPAYTITFILGFAQFGSSGVDAGVVKVGTDTLAKQTIGTTTYYMNNFASGGTGLKSVNFSYGYEHNWTVSGSANIPAITSGLYTLSPKTPFTINSPADSAEVAKANGLNINWTNASPYSASDSILIVIVGPGGSFMKSGIAEALQSSQGYTVSSSDLSSISGWSTLQVVKYRYNIVSVNSKSYVVIAEIVMQKTINLE